MTVDEQKRRIIIELGIMLDCFVEGAKTLYYPAGNGYRLATPDEQTAWIHRQWQQRLSNPFPPPLA